MHSSCCKPPVCGTLLGQPQKTNTVSVISFLKPSRTQHARGVGQQGRMGLAGSIPGGQQQQLQSNIRTRPKGASRAMLLGLLFQSSLDVACCEHGRMSPTSLLSPHLPMRGSQAHAVLCCAESLSHVRVFATPWRVVRQAPLSTGILQARTLGRGAMPSSRGSSQPRD